MLSPRRDFAEIFRFFFSVHRTEAYLVSASGKHELLFFLYCETGVESAENPQSCQKPVGREERPVLLL